MARYRTAGEEPAAVSLRARLLNRGDLATVPRPKALIADTLDRRTVAFIGGRHGHGDGNVHGPVSCSSQVYR